MARTPKSPEQKLAELEQQRRQIDERIKRESAKVKATERKNDTRRKILAGAVALAHADHDPSFRDALNQQIQKNVTRAEDRALFGLFPLES